MDLKEGKEKFKRHLKRIGYSSTTITSYNLHLEDLIKFLAKKNRISEVTKKDLEKFLKYLKKKGYKDKSITIKTTVLKSFFKFLESKGLIKTDPASALKHLKEKEKEPRILSVTEFRALRDAAKDDVRYSAIIEILLQTGIKIGELVRIKLGDLKSKENTFEAKIKNPKGKIDRTIILNSVASTALKKYLKVRPKIKEKTLFLTRTGRPLLIRNIRSTVANYYKKAGIIDASIHDIRHTFCAYHLRKGTNILVVAQSCGHKKISTTEKYLKLIKKLPASEQLEKNAL